MCWSGKSLVMSEVTVPMKAVMLLTPNESSDREIQNRNLRYATACARECLNVHLETPFWAKEGDLSRFIWGLIAQTTVVYTDFGVTEEMTRRMQLSEKIGRPVVCRSLLDFNVLFDWRDLIS